MTQPIASTSFLYDLAISAVPYDADLVGELSNQIGVRLRTRPIWQGVETLIDSAFEEDRGSPLSADASRIAVVLHQRLWRHDAMTRFDDVKLRERALRRPGSIRVVTLDDQPVPRWLAEAPRRDLTADGVDGVSKFLLEAVTSAGGSVYHKPESAQPAAQAERTWPERPPPFLAQPRAFSSLRRELDALGVGLKPKRAPKESGDADQSTELLALPNRLVLRIDDVGVSFSWVSGRMNTVSDGRLLVIQWEGVAARVRGVGALKSATPVRERIYRPESEGPEDWRWREDSPNGRACSTLNLAAEWIAAASITTSAALAARTEG